MKRGQKPKLDIDPKLTERICLLLADGVSIKSAANLSGVSERAYHEWQRRGQAGEAPYADFFEAASRARAGHMSLLIARVVAAAKNDWKAASWLLEKSFPTEFGNRDKPEEQRGANGLLPPTAAPPIVHVTIQRDKATDEARKLFGEPPPNRTRTRLF